MGQDCHALHAAKQVSGRTIHQVHRGPQNASLYFDSIIFVWPSLYCAEFKAYRHCFFNAACIPMRLFVLSKRFTKDELILLDSEDKEIEKWLQDNTDSLTSDSTRNEVDFDPLY